MKENMEEAQFQNKVAQAMMRPLADLQAELARTNKSMPHYRIIQTALTTLKDQRQLAELGGTERRHRESLAVDKSARLIAVLALIVAVAALLNDFGAFGSKVLPTTQEPPRLPLNSTPTRPSVPTSVPLSSAGTDHDSPTPTPIIETSHEDE